MNEIALLPYERKALEATERKFALSRELVVGLAISLNLLARLFEEVTLGSNFEFRAGRVVVIGLVNHVHHLLIGGLQALECGNGAVWSACVRGLMETFGATVLISESPGAAPDYLKHVRAGRLRNAAERAQPGLLGDIKRLDSVVHPMSGAIYAGLRPHQIAEQTAIFSFGFRDPAPDEGREGVTVLANLARLLSERLEKLASSQEVISAGDLIMIRQG